MKEWTDRSGNERHLIQPEERKSPVQMEERLPNVHPGDVLLEDYLKPLGMSVSDLGKAIGLPWHMVEEIVRGRRSVSAYVALCLSRYFGTSARFWMNLQVAYDLEEEEQGYAEELAKIQPRVRESEP